MSICVDPKSLRVLPIAAASARAFVRATHYSGKVTHNSQLHLGVFFGKVCGGVLQFGPPIDKRRMRGLVRDTPFDGFLELNRMVLAEWLPKNSESRVLSVALRMIRRAYPRVQWIVTFADGTQCGDGTIYRACGFVLTGVKRNTGMLLLPGPGRRVVARKSLDDHVSADGAYGSKAARAAGARPLDGFQIRYVYFLDPTARGRLTVPELAFSEIVDRGASMYRGQARERSRENAAAPPRAEGGVSPTRSLQP